MDGMEARNSIKSCVQGKASSENTKENMNGAEADSSTVVRGGLKNKEKETNNRAKKQQPKNSQNYVASFVYITTGQKYCVLLLGIGFV